MTTLIARLHLIDRRGDRAFELDLREGCNREVVLRLASPNGTPYSLSTLQTTVRFPAFWGKNYSVTYADLKRAVRSGLYGILEEEKNLPKEGK